MSGSSPNSWRTRGSGILPYPLPASISLSQVHPYSAGWETRLLRLAPNTSDPTRTISATTVPQMLGRAGRELPPGPGPNAKQIPAAAVAGTMSGAAAGRREAAPRRAERAETSA